jgi:hypothetical protein
MSCVLPVVSELAGRHHELTIFTRFIPPQRPSDMPGMWQRYYTRWKEATREHLNLELLELSPALANLCPPATVLDKTRYSAFSEPNLLEVLRTREADGLIVTGSETDVCVLATALDAVDLGYRVILVKGHDALMKMYHQRAFSDLGKELRQADRTPGTTQTDNKGREPYGCPSAECVEAGAGRPPQAKRKLMRQPGVSEGIYDLKETDDSDTCNQISASIRTRNGSLLMQ